MELWKPREVAVGDFFLRYDFDWKKGVGNSAPRKHFCLVAATGAAMKLTYFSASWDAVVLFLNDRTQRPEVTRHDITQYTIRKKQLSRTEVLPDYHAPVLRLLEEEAQAHGFSPHRVRQKLF